uniref:Uncharacterized protein n=1 Tax=Mycena chlorophos TaxID=658473 RepID=A0ABQ0KUZ2_MYCCL|nr:predicted protein [Mycena chlorophos]
MKSPPLFSRVQYSPELVPDVQDETMTEKDEYWGADVLRLASAGVCHAPTGPAIAGGDLDPNLQSSGRNKQAPVLSCWLAGTPRQRRGGGIPTNVSTSSKKFRLLALRHQTPTLPSSSALARLSQPVQLHCEFMARPPRTKCPYHNAAIALVGAPHASSTEISLLDGDGDNSDRAERREHTGICKMKTRRKRPRDKRRLLPHPHAMSTVVTLKHDDERLLPRATRTTTCMNCVFVRQCATGRKRDVKTYPRTLYVPISTRPEPRANASIASGSIARPQVSASRPTAAPLFCCCGLRCSWTLVDGAMRKRERGTLTYPQTFCIPISMRSEPRADASIMITSAAGSIARPQVAASRPAAASPVAAAPDRMLANVCLTTFASRPETHKGRAKGVARCVVDLVIVAVRRPTPHPQHAFHDGGGIGAGSLTRTAERALSTSPHVRSWSGYRHYEADAGVVLPVSS